MRRAVSLHLPAAAAALVLALAAPASAKNEGAFLGVHLRDLDEETVLALGVADARGALVVSVVRGSPARKAGIEKGDLIVELDGKAVASADDVSGLVAEAAPGTSVKLKVLRDGKKQTLEATLAERESTRRRHHEFDFERWMDDRPGSRSFTLRVPEFWRGAPSGKLGVRVADLNPDLGEYFKTAQGALVLEVDDDSPASRAGMKAGDVITAVSGAAVADRDDLIDALDENEAKASFPVKILRKGKTLELTVTSGKKRRSRSSSGEA